MNFCSNNGINTHFRYSVSYRIWKEPHKGDNISQYADGYSTPLPFTRTVPCTEKLRFSIADGASGFYFSKRWADALASSYIQNGEACLNQALLFGLSEQWKKRELAIINERDERETRREIRRRKLQNRGGAATMTGLEINFRTLDWRSVAVGDSCVFHLRKRQTDRWEYTQNPELSADEFSNTPNLIQTHQYPDTIPTYRIRGKVNVGDIFLLGTDAISQWIVDNHSKLSFEEKIASLCNISTNEEFSQLISTERDEYRMCDDDVTISIITISKEHMIRLPRR